MTLLEGESLLRVSWLSQKCSKSVQLPIFRTLTKNKYSIYIFLAVVLSTADKQT